MHRPSPSTERVARQCRSGSTLAVYATLPSMTQDNTWTELSLRVAQDAGDDVADLLQQATGSGVTIEPPIEALGPDEGYILDTRAPYTLRAYIYGAVSPAQRRAMRDRIRRAGLADAVTGSFV